MSGVNKNILLCCTGSVATIKVDNVIENLKLLGNVQIKVVFTKSAFHFCDASKLKELGISLHDDAEEWSAWQGRGDPVLHIELGKWADIMLIAPLDANTLAKIAQGLCDNLLTCIVRAWDFQKPLIFCPAMNTRMWNHPITSVHVSMLKSWGCIEIPCISKKLMCNDVGLGAMAEPEDIATFVRPYL